MKMGLRTRLIGTLLIATLIFFAISAIAAKVTMSNDLNALGAEQVQSGSTAFGGYWDQKRDQIKILVGQVGIQDAIRRFVAAKNSTSLSSSLTDTARQAGLSFLVVVNTNGQIIGGANDVAAGTKLDTTYVGRAITGETVSTAAVLGSRELTELQLLPQVQATVKNADGGAAGEMSKGLAIVASAPISDAQEHTLGAVYGGVVINHYYDLVDTVSSALGGKTAILLGDTVVSGTVSNTDGTRMLDTQLPVAGDVIKNGKPWSGVDTEAGVQYLTTITPIMDDQQTTVGALWYGVPLSKYTDIQNHTLLSILLWGLVGLVVALLVAIPVVNGISANIIRRSKQVSDSAKELAVVVVASEVSGDHVAQTLQTVERAGGVITDLKAAESGGGVATAVSEKIDTLASLNAEIQSDVVVIDTLAREMSDRMQDAETRVAELNDVAKGLRKLVTGSNE